jgi:hypothetical protein
MQGTDAEQFLLALATTARRLGQLADAQSPLDACPPQLPFLAAPLHQALSRPLRNTVSAAARAVPAAFRLSGASKGATLPRHSSPYLATLLRNAKAAVGGAASLALPTQQAWQAARSFAAGAPASCALARAVATDVAEAYTSVLTSVLDNASHMDASLQWLRHGQTGAGGGGGAAGGGSAGGLTESDRIGMQLWLDTLALSRELLALLEASLGGASAEAAAAAFSGAAETGASDAAGSGGAPSEESEAEARALLLRHLAPLPGAAASPGAAARTAFLVHRGLPAALVRAVQRVKPFSAFFGPAAGAR